MSLHFTVVLNSNSSLFKSEYAHSINTNNESRNPLTSGRPAPRRPQRYEPEPLLEPMSQPLFCPTVQEVLAVKTDILTLHKLPVEIIDTIIDFAEYWPCTTVRRKPREVAAGHVDVQRGLSPGSNKFVIRSFPLGYSTHESHYALPMERYLVTPCIAREARASEAVQASTSDLLAQWTTLSLPRTEHPCRKITFTIRSKDQGWGGDFRHRGTYKTSYTWYDVGLEHVQAIDRSNCTPDVPFPEGFSEKFRVSLGADREDELGSISCDIATIDPTIMEDPFDPSKLAFVHPFMPPPTMLQSNILAEKNIKEHIITWSYDDVIDPDSPEGTSLEEIGRGRASGTGDYVRQLKVGDIITVWARARFPGWTNYVDEVKVDVYWAV